jgi:hypothetical protein
MSFDEQMHALKRQAENIDSLVKATAALLETAQSQERRLSPIEGRPGAPIEQQQ